MSKPYKRWIYHKTKKPKIIESNDFEMHKAQGWSDTPADFITISDFGVDGNDPSAVQVLGEAIQGVRDAANGALNLDTMTLKELREYGQDNFSLQPENFKSAKHLRTEIKGLLGA